MLSLQQTIKNTPEATKIGLEIHHSRNGTNVNAGLGSSLDKARQKNSESLSHVEPLVFQAVNGRLPTIEDSVIPGDVFARRKKEGLRQCDMPIEFEHAFTGNYDDVMGYEIKSCDAGMNLVADRGSVTYQHDLFKPFILYHNHGTHIEPVGFRFGCEVAQKWNTTQMRKDPGYFVPYKALHKIEELPDVETLRAIFKQGLESDYRTTRITNFKEDCEKALQIIRENLNLTKNIGFRAMVKYRR